MNIVTEHTSILLVKCQTAAMHHRLRLLQRRPRQLQTRSSKKKMKRMSWTSCWRSRDAESGYKHLVICV